MAIAAPAAAAAGRAVAGKAAQGAAGKGAQAAAGKAAGGKGAQAAAGAVPTGKTPAKKPGGAGGGGKGGGGKDLPDLPERGSWKERSKGSKGGGGKLLKAGAGSQGTYRKALVAEFIVCVLLLGLSPLAKGSGEMGPVRFMKRGTATAALFIILGLVSSFGTGAARASAMFGGLVTLVLLVDQREAFGRMATLLNAPDDEADADPVAGVGPDDSTDAGPDVVAI